LKTLYKYNPSFLYRDSSKYKTLTEKYEENFKNYIQKKTYDKELLYEGIKNISEYVFSSFLYGVNEKYDNKTPQEKVIYAIFFRYSSYLGSRDLCLNLIKDNLFDLAENSLFYALGMDSYKKRTFVWGFKKTFIRHCINNVYVVLLEDYFKSIELNLNSQEHCTYNTNNIEELINTKNIPEKSKENILKYLSCEIEINDLSETDMFYMEDIYQEIL